MLGHAQYLRQRCGHLGCLYVAAWLAVVSCARLSCKLPPRYPDCVRPLLRVTDGVDLFVFRFERSIVAGDNQVLAGKAGAIDAVVATMRAHVANGGVSQQACLAMRNICFDNGECAS